jgi:hypothetical protein
MAVRFSSPKVTIDRTNATWHGQAVARNQAAVREAMEALRRALLDGSDVERILLRAAAGAGKSYTLKAMVQEALAQSQCSRVGITAFANKQIFPLAGDLARTLGKDRVCLFVSKDKAGEVEAWIRDAATVVSEMKSIPKETEVLVATSHMLGYTAWQIKRQIGVAADRENLFDVLFVDEAWQLPLHRYRQIDRPARVTVGVGDVGQLPPLDPSANPWRGDPGYNPYRAWPTQYEQDKHTWSIELPSVWRPTIEQLALWRAFYPEWTDLNCVAGPGDRSVELAALTGDAAEIWRMAATGVPTLIEVDGLDEPEAPDVDHPLLAVVEQWLDALLAAGFRTYSTDYDAVGAPNGHTVVDLAKPAGDRLVAVLATRNQAVDDAHAMVDRLTERHDLARSAIAVSTVDSWQGQTNAITVAIHPLSGASQLDEFNSAFGRLAVTCTRATHGLLLVSRAGLDELLDNAPARPGTPYGEPGNRQLPRQTHQRILDVFVRGHVTIATQPEEDE